ncbi:hypothetical protein ES703_105667 [subsurface metagenome]
MATIAEKVFNFILEDKQLHQKILGELPADKRAAVTGRKGRLIVTGPEGGSFIMRLTPLGIFREDTDREVRNEILMSDNTLIGILVWIAKLPNNPGISPRAAYTNGFLKISGESVLYDAEEIFLAMEKHAFAKMKPIAREAVAGMKGVESAS